MIIYQMLSACYNNPSPKTHTTYNFMLTDSTARLNQVTVADDSYFSVRKGLVHLKHVKTRPKKISGFKGYKDTQRVKSVVESISISYY